MPRQLTTAQQALIHTAISLGVSALFTIAGLVYQFVLGHGLDIPSLLKFVGPLFLGQLSLIWTTLQRSPVLAQAEADTLKDIPLALQGVHDKLDSVLQVAHSHPVPPAQPAAPQPQFKAPALPDFTAPLAAISQKPPTP